MFYKSMSHQKGQEEEKFSLFLSLEIVVVAILLCSLVMLPNYVNAQPAPSILPPNQGILPNPAQMPFQQPTTDIPNTINIVIPQGAATERLANVSDFYYLHSPSYSSTGQPIIWNNKDLTTHTAVADDGSFNTGEIQPGSNSSAIVIQSYGEYAYHCIIHPHMRGLLEVLPRQTTSSQTIDLNHRLEQALLEVQHFRLTEQARLEQMQAIAASPPPEHRLTQIASVEHDTINSINVLKELFSMQPEQQILRLQELLLQLQQQGQSQSQGQPTIGAQIIQTALALDPENRDRAFLITLGHDRDTIDRIELLSIVSNGLQEQTIGAFIQNQQQIIQGLQQVESQIQQRLSSNVPVPTPQPIPG